MLISRSQPLIIILPNFVWQTHNTRNFFFILYEIIDAIVCKKEFLSTLGNFMKIVDKKIKFILDNPKLNSKFVFSKHKDLNINCNILTKNFYLDSHNYFPITEEFISFLEVFTWGEKFKYQNFYSESFKNNFKKNMNNFKSLSDVFVLGSSSADNYYRNMICPCFLYTSYPTACYKFRKFHSYHS